MLVLWILLVILVQICHSWQCLPGDVQWVQQPFHPHLWGEWSWEDRSIQEDLAVLRSNLSNHGAAADCPWSSATLQSCSGGKNQIKVKNAEELVLVASLHKTLMEVYTPDYFTLFCACIHNINNNIHSASWQHHLRKNAWDLISINV